jgi:hypothetical protein
MAEERPTARVIPFPDRRERAAHKPDLLVNTKLAVAIRPLHGTGRVSRSTSLSTAEVGDLVTLLTAVLSRTTPGGIDL